jgi:bifunctional non-homologous end joining protein LigD
VVPELSPQLLVPLTPEEAEPYITRQGWGAQEKFDGKRIMVDVADGQVTAVNKQGRVIECPARIAAAVKAVGKDLTVDGEWISTDSVYVVFDLLKLDTTSLRNRGYHERYKKLDQLGLGGCCKTAELAVGEAKIREFILRLKSEGREGFVLKDLSASYSAGRLPTQLKVKFWESASCVVLRVNYDPHDEDSRRSIAVALGGQFFGNVTVPPNYDMPAVGDVVEIKYLYAVRHLVQPQYLGVRDDVDPEECTVERQRIKFKRGYARESVKHAAARLVARLLS